MVQGEKLGTDIIRSDISLLGDSLLVVGDEKVVKVHIHTNNPGQVLEKCLAHGSLHQIKMIICGSSISISWQPRQKYRLNLRKV